MIDQFVLVQMKNNKIKGSIIIMFQNIMSKNVPRQGHFKGITYIHVQVGSCANYEDTAVQCRKYYAANMT